MEKIGIICSSGGSACLAALKCLTDSGQSVEPIVVVDRSCGIFTRCQETGIQVTAITYDDKNSFSLNCARFFVANHCRNILLFYTRLIDPVPFDDRELGIFNVHPSVLPAFPGMGAVQKAHQAGSGVLGATIHRVDAGMDTGPIVAQVAAGVPANATLQEMEHISYLQKVYLMLVWTESILAGTANSVPFQPVGTVIECGNMGLQQDLLRSNFLTLCDDGL
jgi:phosphoribosylglycinamide formyltransferase-1